MLLFDGVVLDCCVMIDFVCLYWVIGYYVMLVFVSFMVIVWVVFDKVWLCVWLKVLLCMILCVKGIVCVVDVDGVIVMCVC